MHTWDDDNMKDEYFEDMGRLLAMTIAWDEYIEGALDGDSGGALDGHWGEAGGEVHRRCIGGSTLEDCIRWRFGRCMWVATREMHVGDNLEGALDDSTGSAGG